jgi:hypothetical protein
MGQSIPLEIFDDEHSDDESEGDRFLVEEGLYLLAVYRKIRDPWARKAVLKMIEALIAEQDQDTHN